MSAADDYDKMTKEEREARDKADRQREREEQAALPYTWRQELGDVDIVVPLSVGLKGKDKIMDGELCKDIKVEDSTWTLEDQEAVHIHLEKVNKQQWWANVLTHHPKLDTTKIQPENSKLSDLDGETRGMVEKMMFDNQQKLNKMEALKKFQAAHPELDFSNAKIS
ncbi:nuclear movement protein nudC [Amylocystis lapponica]|nr:nuclear movement protein nudC [Amylocystis lapponica]